MSRVVRPTLVLVLVLLRFGIGWEVLLGTNWFGFGFTTRNSTPTALKPKPTSKNSGEFQRAETIQWTNQDSKPTCSRHKARENGCERLTLGFHFLIGWRIKAARRLERGLTSAAETVFFLFHAPVFVFFYENKTRTKWPRFSMSHLVRCSFKMSPLRYRNEPISASSAPVCVLSDSCNVRHMSTHDRTCLRFTSPQHIP